MKKATMLQARGFEAPNYYGKELGASKKKHSAEAFERKYSAEKISHSTSEFRALNTPHLTIGAL